MEKNIFRSYKVCVETIQNLIFFSAKQLIASPSYVSGYFLDKKSGKKVPTKPGRGGGARPLKKKYLFAASLAKFEG